MFDKCTEEKSRKSIFTAKEDGKTFTLNNIAKSEISKIKIDGCVFNEETKKCDWLFLVEDKKAIFVELKGSSIRHGLQQLEESYKRLQSNIENRIVWFRLSIGEKNSVPRSIRSDRSYKFLFSASKDNLKIGKQLSDTLN